MQKMKIVNKEPVTTNNKKAKRNNMTKHIKPEVEKLEDVKKLVELLQIHQIELEHQNQELRITQAELEASRNKYVNLFDFSPIPYFSMDPEGIIKEVNLSAGKMLGLDRSKLIGKKFIAYVILEYRDIYNSFIKNVFNSLVKHSCEINLFNKDKQTFQVLLEGLEFDNAPECDQICQVAVIDLTEYKKIEAALKETTEKLKLLNDTKDKFFSIIAHDLRSPFQSLLSSTELLATEIETLSKEEISKFSRGINNNMRNLYDLMENLLHWSLLQRNMINYKPGNFNLYTEVNKIIENINQDVVKKKILLYNNIEEGTSINADINMFHSIVQNLLINAIKFTETEGKIIVSAVEKKELVEVSIQDTGTGINPEITSKLFNFAKQYTTDGTTGEKGTGLGLPLCKEFVERNGGKIWVESELGKGSKFTFTLQKTVA
jgi:PAS domain S-box-containing protein